MAHRLAPEAESDLDEIWYHLAKESGDIQVADRLIDTLITRFVTLGTYPHIGRRRDEDLRPGLRSFPVGRYMIIYRMDGRDTLILRIFPGNRDIPALL